MRLICQGTFFSIVIMGRLLLILGFMFISLNTFVLQYLHYDEIFLFHLTLLFP